MDGRVDDSEDLLRNLVFTHPEDPIGWLRLSELLNHGASFAAAPLNVAEEPTRRLLGLDPSNVEGLVRAARIAAATGAAPGRLEALAAQAAAIEVDASVILGIQAAAEALQGELSASTVRRLTEAPEEAARIAAGVLATGAQDMGAALNVLDALTDVRRPAGVRALAEIWGAYLHLAQGQRGLAVDAFGRAGALDPDLATEHEALAYTLPFLHWDPAQLRRVAARMERWRPGGARANAAPEPHYQMHLQSRPVLAPYLAARLALAAGDTAAAALWAMEIRASPWTPENPPLPQALAASIDADVARVSAASTSDEEALAVALDSLQAAYRGMAYQLRQPSLFLSLARERWLIAEVLADLGRTDEASRWFEPYWGLVTESVFTAPSLYRRAQLREAAGEAHGAVDDYERFLTLWSGADPELSAWVDDARARVAALRSN
jgi:hypothetical protein